MKKKILSLILALALLLPALWVGAGAESTSNEYIMANGVVVRWDDYPSSNNQCWSYANKFYVKIWGHMFDNLFSSSENMLRNMSDSELTMSVEHLRAYVTKAELGSVLRICNKVYLHGSDGWGHSMVIVQKDRDGFTVFEGGLDKYPYCRERYYTWEEFVSNRWLGGKYGYIKYIKWPGAVDYRDVAYGYPDRCESFDSYALVEVKEESALWNYPCTDETDGDAAMLNETAAAGDTYTTTALYRNTEGQLWYQVQLKSEDTPGLTGYIPCEKVTFKEHLTGDVTVTDASSPTSIAKGHSFAVEGLISSKYNRMTEISAYVYPAEGDTEVPATGASAVINGYSYKLKNSDLDRGTRFGTLAAGHYRYVIAATASSWIVNAEGEPERIYTPVVIRSSEFEVDDSPLSHSYEATVLSEATCTESGLIAYACSGCGSSYTEPVPAKGHTCTQEVVAPTCVLQGYTRHTCTVCGDIHSDAYVPATGHEYGGWTVVKEPGCEEMGELERICALCGQSQTGQTEATGHSHTNTGVTPPTCTEQGYTTYTCPCGDSYQTDFTDPTGHSFGEWQVTVPATMKQTGEKIRTCPCGAEEIAEIPVLPPIVFTDIPEGAWFSDAVNWAVTNDITTGIGGSFFGPENLCSRAQVVTFLWRAAGSPEPKSTDNPFADVKETSYYYRAVLWAAESGITSGTSANLFGANEYCSRAQVATFLWRMKGAQENDGGENPFTDVKNGAWYTDAVLWAARQGITSGTSQTTFAPDAFCTRSQIVTFLYRCMG